MNKEIWKPAFGYEGIYEVSSLGRVKSKKRILKQGVNHKGYPYINLQDKNGIWKQYETHRIIALTFIPNPQNKLQVDHIDGDKTNNKAINLRWTTPKENSNNPNTLKKLRNKMADKAFIFRRWNVRKAQGGKTAPKTIYMYDKMGNFIKEFISVTEAAKEIGCSHSTISIAIDSKTRTAGGYKWYSKRIEPTQ